jgi:thiosulfate/3-mercaptopyruvate sulfurtransferase
MIKFRTAFLFLIMFQSWAGSAIALTIELDKPPKISKEAQKLKAPKPNYSGPVILDTRGAFEYNMGHLRGAQAIRWEDYSQTEYPHKGSLDPDLAMLARKLRVLGISPTREVIVLGKGEKGWGEEGRIAWMLSYLGIKNIKVRHVDSMQGKKAFGGEEAVDASPLWTPKVNETLRIRLNEVQNLVANKSAGDFVIIDVRMPEEYKGEKAYGEKRLGHIPGAVNIPWTEFVGADGNPMEPPKVAAILKSRQVDPQKQLVFYCTGGVRSGYVTFVASQTGLRARNFDGSFWEWSADERLPVEK